VEEPKKEAKDKKRKITVLLRFDVAIGDIKTLYQLCL